jgi:very-short-patch-repair endonuclease
MNNQKKLKLLEDDPRLTIKKLFQSSLKEEFEGIYNSLKITNPRQLIFHYKNNLQQIPSCKCGNNLSWNQDSRKYRIYCSKSCSAKFSVLEKKKKNLSQLGVEWHSQTSDWKNKVEKTSMEKYNQKHYSQTESFQQSVINTNRKKYGVDYPSQSKEISEKTINAWIDKFQTTNPFLLESVKEKIKKTNKQRYGTEYPSQNKRIKEKTRQTNIKKYGVENPSQVHEFLLKRTNSFKENYYNPETLNKLNDPLWLQNQQENKKSITEISNDLGVSNSNLGKYYKKYNIEIVRHCETYQEKMLKSFLNDHSIDAVFRNRNIISPYEIDCFIKDFNLAIEINGVYWHSEKFNKDKFYHLNKTENCLTQNIELWHFWDFEFQEKQQLIFNKILAKLGMSKKIGARTLKIKHVNSKDKNLFFKKNHLQNDTGSSINIGLYNNDELLMCCSFSKSRFNKNYHWELIRLASEQTYTIQGGASKIINYFIKNHMSDNEILVSYCNRRFSSGDLYKKLNFNLVSRGKPSYCYVHGNKILGSRNAWQKHLLKDKLKIYNPNLSECENMKNNNFYRLWDCGQDTWILKKKFLDN